MARGLRRWRRWRRRWVGRGWDGCGVDVINNECIIDQGRERRKEEGGRQQGSRQGADWGRSRRRVVEQGERGERGDLQISKNGQYKHDERTILISPPPHVECTRRPGRGERAGTAIEGRGPCLPATRCHSPAPAHLVSSSSLSQRGATDKVGKWLLDRERSGGLNWDAWGMGKGEETEIASAAAGPSLSLPATAKLLPLALCERFPALINLRAALNSHASTGWPGPQMPCTSKSPRVWLSRASEALSPSVPVAIDHPTANHLLTRSAYTCYGANAD